MDEGVIDLSDFSSSASDGTPLIRPSVTSSSYTSSPPQTTTIPIDRLRKFEEFIDSPAEKQQSSPATHYSLASFQPYFNVTTELVLARLKKALLPFWSTEFFDDSPADLYTPFWIATTLIVALTVAGNTANYLTASEFTVNLSLLVSCATLVYSLLALVPMAAFCVLKQTWTEVKLVDLVAIYGYSYAGFVPAVAISGLEVGWARWPVLLLAAFWSFSLLRLNFQGEIESRMPNRKLLLLVLLLSTYVLFLLTVDLNFLAVDSPPAP